jgi:DNA-directed RNA polymerase subunit RPC12/RpoP
MTDLINLLQTLALVLTLLLVIFILLWIVYAFRKFVVLFNKMIEEIEKSLVRPQKMPVSEPEPVEEEEPPAPPENVSDEPKQYHCETCNAKLPLIPKHSVIKDTITLLVFKCRRCGKETEVDPAKGQPK